MRRLKKNGIHPRRVARKLFLTGLQKEKRLIFALAYRNKGEDFWRFVIFLDEKTFGYGFNF